MYQKIRIEICYLEDSDLLTESPNTTKDGVYEEEILDIWTE